MKTFSLKFPKLSERIFQQLNNKSLLKCKRINRNWYKCIDNHRIQWIRKIEKIATNFDQFRNEWKMVVKGISLENLKKICTILLRKKNQGYQRFGISRLETKTFFLIFYF